MSNATRYTTRLENIRAEDRDNPYLIAEGLENTLLREARKSAIIMFPGIFVGLAGMATAAVTGNPLLIWAAVAVMTIRTAQMRQIEMPRIRNVFNAAAAHIHEVKPKAELKKVGDILAEDKSSAQSWLSELDPRKHPIRTPFVAFVAAWGLISGAPAMIPLAAFVMASSLLDQQGDHVSKVRDQAAQARGALRPWRTGLHFG